jgi:hypothetical protein
LRIVIDIVGPVHRPGGDTVGLQNLGHLKRCLGPRPGRQVVVQTGGRGLGMTDELGYRAVEDVATLYDLWATVLHCLGVDHEHLTFRHGGRDMRLTDVHGHVLTKILA